MPLSVWQFLNAPAAMAVTFSLCLPMVIVDGRRNLEEDFA